MALPVKVQKAAIIIIPLLIIILGLIIVNNIENTQREYYLNFKSAFRTIVKNEEYCNIELSSISSVWHKAIKNGVDFDTAIKNEMISVNTILPKILNTKSLADNMVKLSSPPSRYKDIHPKLLELYGIYKKLESLTLSPKGSLITYNQQVHSIQSDFLKVSEELKIMMPSLNDK